MKKFALILSGIIAMVFLFAACAPAPAQPEATPEATAAEGLVATDGASDSDSGALTFSMTTLTGDTLDQSVFSDHKLIMVNYWATWCGPCVGEIPDLVKISKDYADKGFVLIGVLTGDDDIEGAKQFIADEGVTYPIVLPEGLFLDYSADIYAIPTTKFFDSTGKQIGSSVVSAKSYDEWAGLIDLLLEQVS